MGGPKPLADGTSGRDLQMTSYRKPASAERRRPVLTQVETANGEGERLVDDGVSIGPDYSERRPNRPSTAFRSTPLPRTRSPIDRR